MADGRALLRMTGWTLARYFDFVSLTSRVAVSVEPSIEKVMPDLPAIFTFWHGEQFLIPAAVARKLPITCLASRAKDGEIQASALKAVGINVVRGSGGRNRKKTLAKGGIQASLELMSALENGQNIGMTANIPRGPARNAAKGVVTLAKFSGRPIFPIAHLTSRNIVLDNWDKAVINLPFSRKAFMLGEKISVSCDADETEIEECRKRLEGELVRINREGRRILGNARTSATDDR
ncbi:MAG: lysophospholipid acyltransferase family protein [Pseudomonadota bacterium]